LYKQEFGAQALARSHRGDRDLGANVVGDKPGKSPGDTSDLPPTGEDLLEMEDDTDSRIDNLRSTVFREVGDTTDALKDEVATVHNILERPPPGHPEVVVNTGPTIGPEVTPHAGVDAGSVAELCMILGVIGCRAAQWFTHKAEATRRR
jgi:hypothetical protein